MGYRNNRRKRDLFTNQRMSNGKWLAGVAAVLAIAWWLHSSGTPPSPGPTPKVPGTPQSGENAAKKGKRKLTPAEEAQEAKAAKESAEQEIKAARENHHFSLSHGGGGEPNIGSTSGSPFNGKNPLGPSQPKSGSLTDGWLARWFPGLASSGGVFGSNSAGGSFDSGTSSAGDATLHGTSPGGGGGAGSAGGGSGGVVGAPPTGAGAGNLAGGGPSFGTKGSGQLGPGGTTGTGAPTFIDTAFGAQNKVVLQNFLNTAHLYVPTIPSCQYITLDLDNGLAGINIYNPLQGVNVSIAAKAGVVTQAQLEAFLAGGDTGLPALSGVTAPASLGSPTIVAATAGSGLQDAHTWEFVSNGHTVQIALMVRSDSQGTYLAIVNAPGTNVTSAIDYYSQYFQQLKAN